MAGVRNGITPVWASEIEPFPIEVTKRRFPGMLHVGDITKLDGAKLPPVDVVTGGSPCQDLSVAGARAGLKGERSGLFMEQIRVVKEMRDADERRGRTAHAVRPRYLLWENVPGAFSSAGGEDFRAVLEEIVRIKDSACSVPRPDAGRWESAGTIVLGDQFSLAWRVLDAQYWGVAQRRKRIYLVADFTGLSAGKILFEQDRLPGYPAPGGGQGQGATSPTGGGAEASSGDLKAEETALAFAANQREKVNCRKAAREATLGCEVRDLRGVAGTLSAQPGMKPQTFVAGPVAKGNGDCFPSSELHTTLSTDGGQAGQGYSCILAAGFCAGASPAAGSIGYHDEVAPTLKGSASGNMMPSVLCLNDQGGGVMDCSEELAGTLRAQEHGHQPLVLFENHGIDSRYTGPHQVAPTMSARYGTGGNNVPLIAREREDESICIAGSTISRDHGGGEGLGCQEEIAYTLTGSDQHAVFSRQRSDALKGDTVAGTQSARQHKEATDLVLDVAGLDCRNGRENGDVCGTLQQGTTGSSLNSIHPIRAGRLIRRLTPLECERLQGYPDGWTELEGASDSARYKALGNSVAIPCVDFVLRGIAYFLNQDREAQERSNPER